MDSQTMWLVIGAVVLLVVAVAAWMYVVQHPLVVENYRTARALMARRERGEASTEELRQAVVNYRALLDDLLKAEEATFKRAS